MLGTTGLSDSAPPAVSPPPGPRARACALAAIVCLAFAGCEDAAEGPAGVDAASNEDGGGGPAVQDPDGGAGAEGDVPPLASPRIAFSEIMYHPVLANADDNDHEFIELHNAGGTAVSLEGWQIQGEVRFTFPAGSSLAPGQYLVVARNRARLLALARYDLGPIAGQVLGDYAGALDDGGGRVVLVDRLGAVVDAAGYDDGFPWPLAADAFGAGDGWFEETAWFAASDPRRDFAAHRHLGHSLERVSFEAPASEVANWVPSPLDGATPGRAGAARGEPPATVEELVVRPEGRPESRVIRASDRILVRARLGGRPVADPQLEYHVEFDAGRRVAASVMPTRVPLVPAAGGLQAALPPLPARTLVRYRITGEREPGRREVLSPRPTDPLPGGAHAFFVSSDLGGKPFYEILVAPEDWGRMWTNVSPDGAVLGCSADYLDEPCRGCQENPRWNARVPAVLVFGGEAYDVRARYQGSMEGRTGADDISDWPPDRPGPSAGPIKAMSWSLSLPRYRRFEGQGRLLLNRLQQSCPGFSHALAAALDEDERGGRIPAPRVRRWARVFVNGAPYNYMMDLEPIGEGYLERFHGKGQPIGDLYKVFSTGDDHGPWGAGTGQELEASPWCPEIPLRTRYERTYERETHTWRSIDELMGLIASFSAARDAGPAEVRAFLQQRFDVDATLKYYAVQQWGAPWDDNGKNYNLYKQPAQAGRSGAFTITSWDVDRMFGVAYCESDAECTRADIPVHCGTDDLPVCNRWKRAFVEAMRPEYDAKLKDLNETLLHPANVKRIVDETLALYDANEANQMLNSPSCDAAVEAAQMKRFADRRYQVVRRQLGY
jgi:hypothetical protein